MELTIVILITLTLLHVGAGAFISVERRQIMKVAADLQNEIRSIQRLSLAEGTEYSLLLASISIYDASAGKNKAVDCATIFKNGDEVPVRSYYLPKGIKCAMNFPANKIAFTSKGTPYRAGAIIIKGNTYNTALTVSVGAGKVSMKGVRNNKQGIYSLNDF